MEFTSIASRYRYVDTLISRNSARVASNVASLSSGKRMVHAGDDVASLSIATKLQARTTTIRSNLTNLAQAGTMLQVMDGALKEVDNILQRLNALATMANSGGISDTERGFLQIEVNNLTGEIDRMLGETNFNGVALFGEGYHTPAAEVPEADIASLYDAKGLTSGTYTVRAGDTVFDTYVETLGEGDDQESWLLIGRGRDGWEFDDDGQGDISLLAGGLGTSGAFDPWHSTPSASTRCWRPTVWGWTTSRFASSAPPTKAARAIRSFANDRSAQRNGHGSLAWWITIRIMR